jgi:hypothetical protein
MNLSPKVHGIPAPTRVGATGTWQRVLAAIAEPNFLTIVAFCTIGLLLTLDVMLRFPDFGSLMESYNQF